MLDSPLRLTMLVSSLVLLSLSAVRWHRAATAAPDVFPGADAPSAVLLVQRGDCPERTAAMTRWLAGRTADRDLAPMAVGVLDEGPGALPAPLTLLPRLEERDTRVAARAVMRAGLPGTPALVLLDGEGRVLLADTFEPTGLGPRITGAAALLTLLATTAPEATGRM